MESIKKFLTIEPGSGSGDGSGSGYGSGSGDGSGYGSGYGFGYGYGFGSGDGFGYGYGSGIKIFDGQAVHIIDGIETIITNVKQNVAKGYILHNDFTLHECYVVKSHNRFAHGETLKQAMEDLENKLFEDMDTDEVIAKFIEEFSDFNKKYPAKQFYIWHHRLTGSCEMGRNTFVKNGGYDLENDKFTVQEFINITKNAFGGSVIKQLEDAINQIKD